ncbi:hypothetical protein Pmar_PMAR004740, partial [Perkinsus marinus ATCC 50983]
MLKISQPRIEPGTLPTIRTVLSKRREGSLQLLSQSSGWAEAFSRHVSLLLQVPSV